MIIQVRTIVVQPGFGDQVAASYSVSAHIDTMPGLIDRTIMVNKRGKESEEVVAMIRWQSEEAWKNWEKDPVHLAGHREHRGQEPPAYLISSTVKMYGVQAVFTGSRADEAPNAHA